MRKQIKSIIFLIPLFCLVFAAKIDASTNSFTVEPLLENQVSQVSYFHKNGTPGQTLTFKVNVKNNETKNIKLDIEPTNGFSNPFGSMHYSSEGKTTYSSFLDEKYKLAPYVSSPKQVILKPNEIKTVSFTVKLPKNIDTGQILGGIHFSLKGIGEGETIEGTETTINMDIKQRYTIGILIDLPIKSKEYVVLGNSKIKTTTKMPEMETLIRNINPVVARNLTLQYKIIKLPEKTIVFNGNQDVYNLAPVTRIYYPVPLNVESLEKGTYLIETALISKDTKQIIDSKENEFEMTTSYGKGKETEKGDVQEGEGNQSEGGSKNIDGDSDEEISFFVEHNYCWWLLLLLLLILMYIVYRLGKKKGEEDKDKDKDKQIASVEQQEKVVEQKEEVKEREEGKDERK